MHTRLPRPICGRDQPSCVAAARPDGRLRGGCALGPSRHLWGADAVPPKRGASCACAARPVPLRSPPHQQRQDQYHLSFVHSTLLRFKVGPEIPPGTYTVEPHLAEERGTSRMTSPTCSTCGRGIKWHNKPPLNGRELVAGR